jgi:hypothetical protein
VHEEAAGLVAAEMARMRALAYEELARWRFGIVGSLARDDFCRAPDGPSSASSR